MRYIYKFTNKINGKKYIGQTNNIQRRLREYKSISNNKNSSNYTDLFPTKMREYGFDNFDFCILEEVDTEEQEVIDEREI